MKILFLTYYFEPDLCAGSFRNTSLFKELLKMCIRDRDKVKQVLDKIKTDGLQPTLEAVFNKLGQPLPLGYCNVGKVVAVGKGVTEFVVGDRVASNGNHAEFVCVPKNLVAKIPDNVTAVSYTHLFVCWE